MIIFADYFYLSNNLLLYFWAVIFALTAPKIELFYLRPLICFTNKLVSRAKLFDFICQIICNYIRKLI